MRDAKTTTKPKKSKFQNENTAEAVPSTAGEAITSGAAAGTAAFKGDFSNLTRQQQKKWWQRHKVGPIQDSIRTKKYVKIEFDQ